MMTKKIYLITMVILTFFISGNYLAQSCPSSGTISATINPTPNTCGGNGSIAANLNSFTNVSIQLIKGGVILQQVVATGSTYTFDTLQPGTDYQIKVICSTDNSVVYQTTSVAVADNYVPITDATISITNVCTNFTPGGTLTVTGVTGGTAPYTYSFYQSSDPAYNDALSTYTTSNTANLTQFGTYQIRVKDACGNYKTFTKTLAPTIDPVAFYWRSKDICGSNQVQASSWWVTNVATGGGMVFADIPSGIRLIIRSDNASGAILYDGIYTGGTFNYIPNSSHLYHVTTINACGVSHSYINDALINPANSPEFPSFELVSGTSGCPPSSTMSISSAMQFQHYWNYPVTVVVKDSSGTTVHTSTINENTIWSVSDLPLGDYTVTMTDQCGNTLTKTQTNPTALGAPTVNYTAIKWRCGNGITDLLPLTQNGTAQIDVDFGGYLPDKQNAILTITSGPSNVGVNAILLDNGHWGWTNLTEGTYQFSVVSCGTTYNFSFTVNSWDLLNQSISSTATSFCSGGGNVNSTVIYDGGYSAITQLVNSATGVIYASNSTGDFSNVPAGTYYTRIFVTPYCSSAYNYYIDGNTVTITNSSTGPSITSSVGVLCEDSSGNPLSTGSAYLTLAGVAPYTLNYKLSGTSTWTTINNASTNTQIDNLVAFQTYDIQLIDACGGTFNNTVQIKTMGPLNSDNTTNPCYNSPYVLTMHYYAGATYQWINPQGTVVSNTRNYSIANYAPSYDGAYQCKITWSTCVTRYVTVYINGNLCGTPITGACFKDPGTSAPILPTNHGITSLGRAGSDNGNWPMVRKGAHTALESKTKGFVINRLTTIQKNTLIPVLGMMVYDTDLDCLSIYTGTSWKCYSTPGCPD